MSTSSLATWMRTASPSTVTWLSLCRSSASAMRKLRPSRLRATGSPFGPGSPFFSCFVVIGTEPQALAVHVGQVQRVVCEKVAGLWTLSIRWSVSKAGHAEEGVCESGQIGEGRCCCPERPEVAPRRGYPTRLGSDSPTAGRRANSPSDRVRPRRAQTRQARARCRLRKRT